MPTRILPAQASRGKKKRVGWKGESMPPGRRKRPRGAGGYAGDLVKIDVNTGRRVPPARPKKPTRPRPGRAIPRRG